MSDEWNVKEFLDRTPGKAERIYTYKRLRCKRVVLNSRLAGQLAGYTLIEKDLRSVAVWLREIGMRHTDRHRHESESHGRSEDRDNYNIIKGLFVASLTFYGKCFSQCEGRRVKLDRQIVDEPFLALHDECISYRNNFAAHSGAARVETVEIALVFPSNHKKKVLPKIYRELAQPDLVWSKKGQEESFLALVEHVRGKLLIKFDEPAAKILTDEVLPKGIEHWSRK